MFAVNEITTRPIRRAELERAVVTLDFLDDGSTVRQTDLFLDGQKAVAAYNTV
jgi:hypothetical protein